MPPCFLQSSPYKGLFILVLVFVILEYIYNTVSDTTGNAVFNSNGSLHYFDKTGYGPFIKTLLYRKNFTREVAVVAPLLRAKKSNFSLDISNVDYVITLPPPFVLKDITTLYTTNPTGSSSPAATVISVNTSSTPMPTCPDISQNLYGRVQIRRYPVPSVSVLEKRFSWLKPGGHWKPSNCTVDKRVAIVIPFRCRGEHLLLFLQHMHPFLKRQQLDYTLFVVEQDGDGPFNRAMLMNIGYVEALNLRKFDCFIFHDVDLLPEDDRNLYTCPEQPRHMSVAIDVFNYRLPYPAIFGGVSAISTEHFKLLNGFSNSFWGWGGEDDDMSNRIRHHRLYISRYPITIARYTMLAHKKDQPNPHRYDVLRKGQKLFDKDGLNNLTYDFVSRQEKLLYTWILVKVKKPKSNPS